MDYGLFGVRFLFLDMKKERCSIDDYSSILQRPLFAENIWKNRLTNTPRSVKISLVFAL